MAAFDPAAEPARWQTFAIISHPDALASAVGPWGSYAYAWDGAGNQGSGP